MRQVSLQHKILFGYLVLVAVIGSMAAILLHERDRRKEIEAESTEIRHVSRHINTAHRRITELATMGESLVDWDEEEYRAYRTRRLSVDSLLQSLKRHCGSFVSPGQIDTLRHLLEEKEVHLLHIMETISKRDEADSLLITQLPEVARRATRVRTVKQKKKGFAGFFGGKKTVQVAHVQRQPDHPLHGQGEADGSLHGQPAAAEQGAEPQTLLAYLLSG